MIEKRAPLGIKVLSAFFAVGAAICLLTIVMLLFSGGAPESIWRLNPEAHVAFQKLGKLSGLLMLIVGWPAAQLRLDWPSERGGVSRWRLLS